MKHKILEELLLKKKEGVKSLALLLDPDKVDLANLDEIILQFISAKVDYIFVGGSLISSDKMDQVLEKLLLVRIPTLLFPGNHAHLNEKADAVLYLSLISGRNADFLIGQHVVSAPKLKKSNLEILPTGYILIDGGKPTTVSYISNTSPIPHDKPDIAAATAMAGELLGLKLTYLDCGSGALKHVSPKMVETVADSVDQPLIVGGGIKTANSAEKLYQSGADVLVIGTAFEQNSEVLQEVAEVRNQFNAILKNQ